MSLLKNVNGKNPRQIAARILRQRGVGGEFTEELLENALAGALFSPADRALCQEIVYGVVRWQATLDWLIARKTGGRRQRPALQLILRLGLYQIFWLDRIPGHAAVNETVELARQNGFGAQAGFVNAVLRGYLREAEATKNLLAELKTSQPALGWSHPVWLVARWQKRWGAERTAQMLAWNNTPPKTCARVNCLKTDAGKLLEKWGAEKVECEPVRFNFLGRADRPVGQDARQRVPTDSQNPVFELKSHPPLASLESFQQGWFYIQDPSTLLAPCLLDPQPGEAVLDLCAAPGGKTTFIAQLMSNQGRIVAQDVSEERLKLIRENCTRLSVRCVEFRSSRGNEAPISSSAFRTPRSEFSQSLLTSAATDRPFDRILVDAPCSNTGVMRRRVDLRWRVQPAEFARLCKIQRALLWQAAPQLKPGGVLVYSTCSLEPEENGEVVKRFLAEHADFKLELEQELLPFADGVDGAYVARLKRV